VSAFEGRIEAIQRGYEEFWEQQNRLLAERLDDPYLAKRALDEILPDEAARLIPVKCRLTLEAALERAEIERREVLSALGRHGRASRGSDALSQRIQAIVQRQPDISEPQLREMLAAGSGAHDTIVAIDDEVIVFRDHDGQEKEVDTSGLKDRLSRIKKRFRSR
jgi:hypothetical protein